MGKAPAPDWPAVDLGPAGRTATEENAIKAAPRFGLDTDQARVIAAEVAAVVSTWRSCGQDMNLDHSTMRALEQAIRPWDPR